MVLLEAGKALLRDLDRMDQWTLKDMDRTDQWTRVICRKVIKAKVWVLHFGHNNPAELQTERSGWKAAQQERSWDC